MKPVNCWDKFLVQKCKGILNYSYENNLQSPILLTILNEKVYFIEIENFLKEIEQYGEFKQSDFIMF